MRLRMVLSVSKRSIPQSVLRREKYEDRALFLFQPLEPAASTPPEDEMRWVVMALSEIRMA